MVAAVAAGTAACFCCCCRTAGVVRAAAVAAGTCWHCCCCWERWLGEVLVGVRVLGRCSILEGRELPHQAQLG